MDIRKQLKHTKQHLIDLEQSEYDSKSEDQSNSEGNDSSSQQESSENFSNKRKVKK